MKIALKDCALISAMAAPPSAPRLQHPAARHRRQHGRQPGLGMLLEPGRQAGDRARRLRSREGHVPPARSHGDRRVGALPARSRKQVSAGAAWPATRIHRTAGACRPRPHKPTDPEYRTSPPGPHGVFFLHEQRNDQLPLARGLRASRTGGGYLGQHCRRDERGCAGGVRRGAARVPSKAGRARG